MTLAEFKTEVQGLGFTFSFKQAMSGSQYISINNQKFRISDHFQPSHYEIQTHVDVLSFEHILNIISNPLFSAERFNLHNGQKVVYHAESDRFTFHELTKEDEDRYYQIEGWRKDMGMHSFLNN